MVKIVMYGVFRKISGLKEFDLNLERRPVKLRILLEELSQRFPSLLKVLFDPELNDPRPNALIIVNGREIGVLNGLDSLIDEGDKVALIPIIHGGASL